jgi:hypothetical protein
MDSFIGLRPVALQGQSFHDEDGGAPRAWLEGLMIAEREEQDIRSYGSFRLRQIAETLEAEWPGCHVIQGYARGVRIIAAELADDEC